MKPQVSGDLEEVLSDKLAFIIGSIAEKVIAAYNYQREHYASYVTVMEKISELNEAWEEANLIEDYDERAEAVRRIERNIDTARLAAKEMKDLADIGQDDLYYYGNLVRELDILEEVQSELNASKDFIRGEMGIYL